MTDMAAMKYSVLVLAAAAMAGGCASNATTKSAGAGNSPLDLNSAPVAAVAPSASYVPPEPQPVMADPIAPVAATPVVASASEFGSIEGGTYTVKKGDTLYRIAKAHYGSGKQWRKIATANPGLTPQSLRVGQKLIIPQ
jgi:5'-nucleotidase/UDP-sugar diphosphatase